MVKAALSILVNKAVLLGCPLRRHGAWAPQDGEGSFAASGGCFSRASGNTITTHLLLSVSSRDGQVSARVPWRDLSAVGHQFL